MVATGEVDALVPERVWQELSRGLMSVKPSRMLEILVACGANARVMPEWKHTVRVAQWVDVAASLPLSARYALFCLDTEARVELAKRLRVPTECVDVARLLPVVLAGITKHAPEDILSLFETCDAMRKPERFGLLLDTASLVQVFDAQWWRATFQTVLSVDAGAAAKTASEPAHIKQVVRAARLAALSDRSD
jgi:tRNA nucleotidyltransferase (CCA-adding enzyme)